MFLFENSSGQGVGSIVIENRNCRLENNRSFIDAFGHKVHRTSGKFAAPLDRFLLHI